MPVPSRLESAGHWRLSSGDDGGGGVGHRRREPSGRDAQSLGRSAPLGNFLWWGLWSNIGAFAYWIVHWSADSSTFSLFGRTGRTGRNSLVLGISHVADATSADRLVLAGVAVSFIIMAGANILIFLGDPRATHTVVFWMLGGWGSRNETNLSIRWSSSWYAVLGSSVKWARSTQ